MTMQPAPVLTFSAEPLASETTDEQFMAEVRAELKRASNLSDAEIADYTEDQNAWLAYKADGYSPRQAVEADMESWD
jgi:hypothetical protein